MDTIYEELLIHVHQVLKEKSDSKEVLFVPNQSLALLPLHAASWKDEAGKKHYLLEEYSISYAPSVSVFKRCQENEKLRSNKTLFVTNPKEDLDASEKEVSFIERLHQPSKNLLRKDATKSAVIEALREDYGFTHFSCHGFYNQASPFDSGLVMADEVIKLSEIISTNLQSNWLTTLSACETGMVDFASPTDEHFGLPLGFIFAGSPSVWASLWSVSDMATSELMQMAYENLSQEDYKDNKPEALRQAQLSMLNERISASVFLGRFSAFRSLVGVGKFWKIFVPLQAPKVSDSTKVYGKQVLLGLRVRKLKTDEFLRCNAGCRKNSGGTVRRGIGIASGRISGSFAT